MHSFIHIVHLFVFIHACQGARLNVTVTDIAYSATNLPLVSTTKFVVKRASTQYNSHDHGVNSLSVWFLVVRFWASVLCASPISSTPWEAPGYGHAPPRTMSMQTYIYTHLGIQHRWCVSIHPHALIHPQTHTLTRVCLGYSCMHSRAD